MEDSRKVWPFNDVPSDVISIYDGLEVFLEEFGQVSRAQQIAFAGFWFQAELLNGGLAQFFSNDTGVLAPEAAEACREVGLPTLASRLEEAMAWFGEPYPRDRSSREEALEAFADNHPDVDGPFDELDDVVVSLIYDEGAGLEQAAVNHIESLGS